MGREWVHPALPDRALVNGTPRSGGFPPSGFDPLRSTAMPRERTLGVR